MYSDVLRHQFMKEFSLDLASNNPKNASMHADVLEKNPVLWFYEVINVKNGVLFGGST